MLSEQQVERYSRQIILPQVGGRGQQKLLSAAIAVVGRRDLSATVALYLAAAGIGRLILSAPSPLSEAAGVNSDCRVSPLPSPVTRDVSVDLAHHCSVIVASGASPEVCDMLNAACVARGTTLVWADTAGSLGLATVFRRDADQCPCYACVRTPLSHWLAAAAAPDAFAEAVAAFIGTVQATEAIMQVVGLDRPATARVMAYDAVAGMMNDMTIARNPHCSTCAAVHA